MRRRSFLFIMPIFILAWFFVPALFITHSCSAATYDYDIQLPDTGNGENNFGRDYIFQKFIPSAATISGIQLYFAGASAVINLCKGALNVDAVLDSHACASGTFIASTTCTTNVGPQWYSGFSDCPFSASPALVPGADYYYEIIGVWTRASGAYDLTFPGQTCGVQADGSSPVCFPGYSYGYMVRNNLRTYSVPSVLKPVIIVPGILGADLVKGNDKLWLDLGKMLVDIGDEFMDPLFFNTSLQPLDTAVILGGIVRKPSILFDYTDGLINELKSVGYAEGNTATSTLFTFPYDWRYGVSGIFSDGKSNVDILRQKIEAIRVLTGSDKVDIIAHSTGGLVVKKYAMDYPTDNHIGKAVFVGVPNLGAPKATKVLLQGDNFGIPFLADQEMKKISENLPVSYDLSPSNEYLTKNGSYVTTVTTESGNFLIKNLDFSQMAGFLTEHNLNSQASANANALHSSSFDNFDLRTVGVDSYSIVGCKSGTLGNLTEYRNVSGNGAISTNGYTTNDITGDGTVPMASADSVPANDSNIFYAIKANHGKMLSANGIRQKIVNIIASTTLSVGNGIIAKSDLNNDPSKCRLSGHWFGIFSPVAIEIVGQNGNRAGIASDGSIQNDIPGADYQVLGEHKFVFVPTDENQTYTINLQGTGNGVFTLKDQTIANDAPVQTAIWGNVPVTADSTGQLTLNGSGGSNIATLSFDQNGSGQSQIIKPSIIAEGNLPDDFTPPTITITSPQSKDYLRSDTIAINAAATDTGTGVFSFGLAFDNKQVENGDTLDLFYEKLGNHSLTASSTDFVGNLATSIIQFRIIATPESAISDVEIAYALGWFKNKGVKTSLISQFKTIVRLEKRIEIIGEKVKGKIVYRKIETIEKVIDKALCRLLLAELKFYKNGKIINDQAYQILSNDINWLINN